MCPLCELGPPSVKADLKNSSHQAACRLGEEGRGERGRVEEEGRRREEGWGKGRGEKKGGGGEKKGEGKRKERERKIVLKACKL